MPERKRFPGSAQIIDLARARAVRAQLRRPRRTSARSPRSVLVVGLAIGALAGACLTRLLTGDELTQYRHGTLLAQGALASALNEQLVGHVPQSTSIRVTATYRGRGGNYCRTFSVTGAASLTGLACRNGAQWQLQTLLSGANSSSGLELNKYFSAAPLSSVAEAQLRSHDWQ
ncbi:MAG TPA: hypothetical protein VNZ06_01610 [Steroidobacteraceae bacterium]|nr:hypothetical protein [Steroidobacteraceae bacterium]